MICLLPLLLLVTTTTQFSLDRRRPKRDQNAVFTRSQSSTLLITTLTPTPTSSLVKTSLTHIDYLTHRTTIQKQNTLSFLMAEDLATHPAIYCSTETLPSLINKDKLQILNFENHAFSAIAAVWGNDPCLS